MTDELDVTARRLVAMAELDDGVFTDSFKAAVSEAGGALAGLDNRIKTIESLTRKIGDMLALDQDLSLTEASERIYDVLRFSVVAGAEQYMAVRAAVLAQLQEQGGTVDEAFAKIPMPPGAVP